MSRYSSNSPRRNRERRRRYKMTPQFPAQDAARTTCPDDGKFCYPSRHAAERTAARIHPGETMRAYQCGDWWHLTSMDADAIERERTQREEESG